MPLFEREAALETLAALRREAAAGPGRVVLLGGEAGIGKTSLLRTFAPDALWGACDPLLTPRPLGPLYDLAPTLGGALAAAVARDAERIELFDALLGSLGRDAHCLVIEDVHWADEATLDLLAWLGRRVDRTRTLLIASYRDDEVGLKHPLRRVMGLLHGATRLSLPALSPEAVHRLSGGTAVQADALHRASGGNPFFVTELLAVGAVGPVPATIADAVLARAAALAPQVRAALDTAAVVGPRVEPSVVQQVGAVEPAALDSCLEAGVLREASAGLLEFRHELARQAILGAIAPARRRALHRRVLAALLAQPHPDAARLAHHADAAGDRDAVLAHAPRAAREAVALGARRQAFEHYARAVRHVEALPEGERAELLEAFALVCLGVGERQAGIDARRKAIALRRQRGETRQEAENLCRLTNLFVGMGRSAEAETALDEAFALLQPLPPCRELGYAWRTRAHLSMLHSNDAVAVRACDEALPLAEQFGDLETTISVLNSKGAATLGTDFEAGCALLERSRQLAQDHGRTPQVYNAEINLGDGAAERCLFERAEGHYRAADAIANNLQMERVTTLGRLGLCAFQRGRWDEAGDLASQALAESPDMVVNRAAAQLVLGRLRARRGDAGTWEALDLALQVAQRSDQLQHLAPVHAARAEAAWLEGDLRRCSEEARVAYDLALRYRHPWYSGPLCLWRRLGGDVFEVPDFVATPYALQLAGRALESAALWRALDCPYEAAFALAFSEPLPGSEVLREALAAFERLGARPAAEALRRRLHDAGVRGLARGPRESTRAHPFGLTTRERQVLQLLCEGLANAQIAQRLHRSVRTVDHHLESVFAKLGVGTRAAAVAAAQREGLTPQSGQTRGAS